MRAIAVLLACLATTSASRRHDVSQADLSPVLEEDYEKVEAAVEGAVEKIDSEVKALPKTVSESWATVSAVEQVGPTLDDIVPKAASNLVITTEGATASDPHGMYWLEVNLSTIDPFSCSRFASKAESLMNALAMFGLDPHMLRFSCDDQTLTVTSSQRPWPMGAETHMGLFATHIKHVNYTESTLADADMLLANKDAPMLEELLQGLRVDMDVTLTKALEEVVALHLQHLASVQNPVPEVNESEVDHGNCSADELPCKYSWEGPCCSLSACLKPEDPEYDYEGYADGQCSFNTTKCWYYCKERNEKNQEMVNGFVEKLVEMFKGASADLRLSYNDTKRRELIGLVPMLNMSYNDLLAQIKSFAAGHPLLYNMSGKPWSEPLADALEAAAYDLDKLESVAVKNLPGMKVTWTFTNVRPFKVLGSLVQDLGLLELLRPTATTPGMIEAGTTTGILATTANTAVTTASPAESFKNWEDFVEFMPPGTASTPRAKAAAVPEEEEVPLVPELDLEREVQKGESLFLDAEEKAEVVMESIDSELPAKPSKELTPLKATFSLGPSLGHFDTEQNSSYMLFHGEDTSYNASAGYGLQVNVTAISEEAATNFTDLCNNLSASLAHYLEAGGFSVKAYSWGTHVTIVMEGPIVPNRTQEDASLKRMMDHVGHVTFTVSASNSIEHFMANPNESIWDQARTGIRWLLDATMTDAVEKALLHQAKSRRPHTPSRIESALLDTTVADTKVEKSSSGTQCGELEVPCEACSWCGPCCTLATCLSPEPGVEDDPIWKETQCRYNTSCSFACPEGLESAESVESDQIERSPSSPSAPAESVESDQIEKSPSPPTAPQCGTFEVPCQECSFCGPCCSVASCLAPETPGEYDLAVWKEEQCRWNETCAFACPSPESPQYTPHENALAVTEKILGLFTGGALDVRVAYDSDMAQEVFKSIPQLNFSFHELQEKYRTLAELGHFEQAAGNPLATAGVELLTAANQSLEYVETVEVTNLPDGIKAMLKFDNMKPFQFIFSLLEGSGILGMLAAPPASPGTTAYEPYETTSGYVHEWHTTQTTRTYEPFE